MAHLNLEQVGRTDDSESPQIGRASITGFNYSSLPAVFQSAGRRLGVTIRNRQPEPDEYFDRSDNLPFAQAGVPAHTLAVTFGFPDYHSVGDEWEKIDYANMEKITRAIALGMLSLARGPTPPLWNAKNPHAAPYRSAKPASPEPAPVPSVQP